MGAFLASWEGGDRFLDKFASKLHGRHDTFDFIVVGAGSAGAVVANRLSENPNWNILLIEAGGEPAPVQAIPLLTMSFNNYKSSDWQHYTVPQNNAGGFHHNQQFLWSQGKSLGGSSNINHMVYIRGSPEDFNNWANVTQDSSWNYENLLPYFRKSEDYDGEWNDPQIHGTDGPIRVAPPDYHPLTQYFIGAAKELGYTHLDLNGYHAEGVDTIQYAIRHGQRDGAYNSYLQHARFRDNLRIYKYGVVNQILINNHNRAYGVEFDRHGRRWSAFATKEVIISAGSIQTPKLLMLSGVGPRDHLRRLQIPMKANLPVGENLQDHISAYVGPFNIDQPRSLMLDRDASYKSFLQYISNGEGPFTSMLTQAAGTFSSSWAKAQGQESWPDIYTMFSSFGIHQGIANHFSHTFGIREDKLKEFYGPSVGKDAITLVVSVGRPHSRGYVRLSSTDPNSNLIIDPKYYEHPDDLPRIVEAIKFNVKLAEDTYAFKKLGSRLTSNPIPGCKTVPFRSDAYWECLARNYAVTLFDFVGTASMGTITDPKAVVDTQLRVFGIQNLRVIDASVMPVIPVGNVQAATIMLAEKGADMIKEFWLGQDILNEVSTPSPLSSDSMNLSIVEITPLLNTSSIPNEFLTVPGETPEIQDGNLI
ncbi:unnamed protein product [Allacma fusca]|uniref:Glucose-methanol-choline oxidoreductase N-terminal domain-containing protein n=1 Tax=Allacma fusca TaxID=39272 RepID=A0A8J2PEQ7_9HEXA|nr:unnamed protein product [Allacma fusca]